MRAGETVELMAPGEERMRVTVRGTLERSGSLAYLIEDLANRSTYLVDESDLTEVEDALYTIRAPLSSHPAVRQGGTTKIAVIEERVGVSKREQTTGRVIIDRAVRTELKPIRADLSATRYEVERVPIGRWAETEAEAAPYKDGEAMVYPVVREELVVTKRLFIEEQLWVRPRTESTTYEDEVAVRRAEVHVHREPVDHASDESGH